jgi:hypothetical protein
MNFEAMTAVQAAGFWSGLLILLLIVLSMRVVLNRRKHRVMFGDGGLEPMTLATRAFGNAAEYTPLAIGALILMALTGCAPWSIHAVGGAFLIGRIVHAAGLRVTGGPGMGRVIGMTLTWFPLLGAAVALIASPLM